MLFDPDFDWELFPRPEGRRHDGRLRTAVVAVIVAMWFVFRPLAVAAALVAVALGDFRDGFRLARAVPDRAGARICMLFAFAWGAWKVAATGVGLMLATIPWGMREEFGGPTWAAFVLGALAWMLGFPASAALTAAGMVEALRSGMRVWIGEGVNQARTLLLGMIISAFTLGVLIPGTVWLARVPIDAAWTKSPVALLLFPVFFVLMFGAPIAILVLLDRIGRRVIAQRPGKFGPKVASVGKWNA